MMAMILVLFVDIFLTVVFVYRHILIVWLAKSLFVHILSLWMRCLIFLLGSRALDAPNEHFVGQYDAAPIPRKKRPIFGVHCFGARCGTDVYIKPMAKFMYQK